ncbi:LysM peptidoglycan-binding domain-containing protein [Lactobacillus delbrueckii]|jgi:LysM repeat protein|uniref:LysM peptidoglycan-binding domain-containing protein n=1 Tax=Lactobacillus delbrueckii TaxID=1584 RepID=UPI0019D14138|nr:LysM domain-containing protein [Lactobacillus delbrueckii]MBN6089822.1 LysM peptidoglycan-binding domain-containing protein [Lactobacillus delbrueckii subsp. bulgaricus]
MDQNAQKPLSRLARQQAVREERKNKQAPWWTALLIAVMMALAAVPLITSQNSDYDAVPQAKKEQAKPKPAAEKTSKVKPAPKVKTYVVKAGDSWAAIAQKYGISAEELAEQNGLDTSSTLAVGQKLKIKQAK